MYNAKKIYIALFLLLIIHPGFSSVIQESIEDILLQSSMEDCIRLRLVLSLSTELPKKSVNGNKTTMDTIVSTASNTNRVQYTIHVKGSTSTKLKNCNVQNYFLGANRKYGLNCAAVFIFAGTDSSATTESDNMSNFLDETNALINVEQHLFIFYTSTIQTSKNLLTSSFSQNIKRKLSVVIQKSVLNMFVLCHYCNGGSPQVLDIPDGYIASMDFHALASNFNGKSFRIAAPRIVPRIELKPTADGKFIAVRGVYRSVFHYLMEKYNFTCQMFPSSGGGTGLRLPNGTWIGAVGDIVNGRADFGLVSTTTFERRSLIDLAFPVEYEFLTFTLEKQKRTFTWKAILWSFTPTMWILIILSFKISILCMWVLIKMSKFTGAKEWSAGRSIIYILGSLLDQGVPGPTPQSTRMFVSFWLFFALVISTLYRSKLLSLLGFPVTEPVPETFKDLAMSNYQYGLQYLGGAAYNTFKTSENGIYKTIFDRMSVEKNPVECIQKTKKHKFSCIGYRGFADWIVNQHFSNRHGRHSLIVASTSSFFIPVGIIMKKHATYLQEFNSFIQPSVESGLVSEWFNKDFSFVRKRRLEKEKHQAKAATVHEDEDENIRPLTLNHFGGANAIVLVGVILATISFFAEFIKNKIHPTPPLTQETIDLQTIVDHWRRI